LEVGIDTCEITFLYFCSQGSDRAKKLENAMIQKSNVMHKYSMKLFNCHGKTKIVVSFERKQYITYSSRTEMIIKFISQLKKNGLDPEFACNLIWPKARKNTTVIGI
jgi:hypothetical protein